MKTFNLTADGNTDAFQAPDTMRVHVSGTFGGGTVTLQEDVKANGVFVDVAGSAKTEAADYVFEGVRVSRYRLSLSGATAPDIDIVVKGDI